MALVQRAAAAAAAVETKTRRASNVLVAKCANTSTLYNEARLGVVIYLWLANRLVAGGRT